MLLDTETTGLQFARDEIIEFSAVVIDIVNGTAQISREYDNLVALTPGNRIPEMITQLTGITNEDVANCRTFKEIAKDLAQSFVGCDIAGFNSNKFDIPMLDQEFQRVGVKFDFTKPRFIDVQTIFHKKEQRTLVAAYKFYCGKELNDAHSASADTRATYEVLKAQLDMYDDLPNDMEALSEFSSQNRNVDLAGRVIYNDKRQEVINFGKYKGQLVEDVLKKDIGYYSWIMQGDFPQNTKDVFTNIKLRSK